MHGRVFYVSFAGGLARSVVSIVFILVGLAIASALAPNIEPMPDREGMVLIVRSVGGLFFFLGFIILVGVFFDSLLASQGPQVRERWYRRSTTLTALFAAGLFAVPSTFAFPVMVLAYLFRPNDLFPANAPNSLNNLIVGLVFSLSGVLALSFMFLVARSARRT